ncbi:amino acid permease [Thermoflavimicrobium dichotomicum]|uniref:L-asparagine transporter n=1 Tax=Thermoflavimicrobium dichotomicum TaxID=46223 RepID=A0A1I3RLA7_9BACL|nr:amino acid permease [Thermoflavimicrobium dichotomicum]SFJ46549.1 L-asparagine transporter [Thermoflavimicrobium dichotomicum]
MAKASEQALFKQENVLERKLSDRQLMMVGLGTAIGTGLFMGSGLVIHHAGPSAVISYAIAAVITFLMMVCLAEMTAKHPTAGSFGSYAEVYIGPWAGYVLRWNYWAVNVVVLGGEVMAVALYMGYWFPAVPQWFWIVAFSLLVICLNARSVRYFGALEYGFSLIKVIAIVAFILLGAAQIFGIGTEAVGFRHVVAHGGWMPNGWQGIWFGTVVAMFSFLGSEIIAVTAGESQNPERSVPRAMRLAVWRLILFYVLAIAVMITLIPWNQSGAEKITQSPFVKVFSALGIPGADHLMNFVVLIAALSAMNAQVYASTRMIFSLARAGHVPASLGKLNKQEIPMRALLLSSTGLVLATALNLAYPNAYEVLVGLTIFGGIFGWFMILITYLRFRRNVDPASLSYRAPLYPWVPAIGILMLGAVLVSLWMDPTWRFTWTVGLVWLGLLLLSYCFIYRKKKKELMSSC